MLLTNQKQIWFHAHVQLTNKKLALHMHAKFCKASGPSDVKQHVLLKTGGQKWKAFTCTWMKGYHGKIVKTRELTKQTTKASTRLQGRNMVYGLKAQSPKYDWDQGSEQRAQGSQEWDQGSQGFWARIGDQIYYPV